MIEFSELRILLVEDNRESLAAALEDIERVLPGAKVDIAADANTALDLVSGSFFDLAICDLKIPAQHGELNAQESAGLRVIAEIRARQPGTPVIILSAYGTIEKLDPYTSGADVFPILGARRIPMCQAVVKGVLSGFTSRLEPIRDGMAALAAIEISGVENIDPMLERAIAQHAVEHEYSAVEVMLASGLSGSINAIIVMSAPGKPHRRLFLKVNDRKWVIDEVDRQKRYVEGLLNHAHWAPTLGLVEAGLRDKGAYFSSLASDSRDLFALVESDEEMALASIACLDAVSTPWRMQESKIYSIRELRQLHLSDDEVNELGIDLSEFVELEKQEVEITLSVAHGDLHGENILISDGGRPVLVDFAYTEVAPALLDPITLEMSLLFHPASPLVRAGVALRHENWANGDYVTDPRFDSLVRRCREWSERSGSPRGFMAMSYAHALRHLKREKTVSREAALAVARSAAQGFHSFVPRF